MNRFELCELVNIISTGIRSDSSREVAVEVSLRPDPYVPPTFSLMEGTLNSELVFVRAPAAVGKSITAQYLSADRNAPLLDLAEVPVGTGSIQGLVAEYHSAGITAFHRGELPIVIDALDEGRLLSGENSLEAFLESTIKFIQQDRTVTNRPKLILFGREDSTDFSRLAVEVEGQDITHCTLQLNFFEEDAASSLIDLSAKDELTRLRNLGEINENQYARRKNNLEGEPVTNLKAAYFSAIEAALDLSAGTLWTDDRGCTFAGYAPVLASIGTLLAAIDNPVVVTNRLKDFSTKEAWDVIDTVIQEIMEREQTKLVGKLSEMQSLPRRAYGPEEQLKYLAQIIGGERNLILTRNISFASERDAAIYLEKVTQIAEEHPFIRARQMANEVLGSRILAHAICYGSDSEGAAHLELLRNLSHGAVPLAFDSEGAVRSRQSYIGREIFWICNELLLE